MRICVFEDEFYRRLLPLAHLRPVFDLRCGQLTLREKIARVYPDAIYLLHSRDYLRDTVKESHPGSYVNEIPPDTDRLLLINGRLLFSPDIARKLEDPRSDVVYLRGDSIVAAWISGKHLNSYRASIASAVIRRTDFSGVKREEFTDPEFIAYPWDLIHKNSGQLALDFKSTTGGKPGVFGKVYDGAHLLNQVQIHVGKGARIKPGAVLDAEKGPIYLARDVEIMPNAVVTGPAFIGEGSVIKAGAKIYGGSSIGEICKVGGEVEESIIHSHSNKQHEGFVGHSYIGEWVNIGADSNTSDLKNDYGPVRVYNDGETVDTGLQFVGLTIGDHSKCGINSMFNTGSVVGVFGNIFGAGTPPRNIPSFSWGGAAEGFVTYRPDKAVEVAKIVMQRRDTKLTPAGENLIRKVFEISRHERESAGVRDQTNQI